MFRSALLLMSLIFIVSCGTKPSANTAATPATASATPAKSMSQRFNGPAVKQNADGKWSDDVKKSSAFDSDRKSAYFTEKSSIGKSYKTSEYTKTEWGGKIKEVPKQTYGGNTDGSRFQTSSHIQHDNAHESNAAAAAIPDNYKTGDFKTSTAHEEGAKRLDKPSNAQVDQRRKVFPEPEVSSWKQQRSLDMKTTRTLLGRDASQE